MKSLSASRSILCAIFLAQLANPPAFTQEQGGAPGGEPGGVPGVSAGSSPGSEGMPDTEPQYLSLVKKAQKKGLTSKEYIGSLVDLGMHYNRQNRNADAQKTLAKALAIIDAGAMKPTKGSVEEKAPTVVDHGDGTVSATVNKPPSPYEDMMENLLPALVQADTNSNHLAEGEIHVKRLIALAQNNRIHRVPNLMFAYNQYSELLLKMHRNKEAAHYKQEADKINSTIRGL